MVMDRAGDLYGNTGAGGLYGYGTAFELTPPAIRPGFLLFTKRMKCRVPHSFAVFE